MRPLEQRRPFAGYADPAKPLGGYVVLVSAYGALVGAAAGWMRRAGRSLPERVDPGDLALVTVATHKATRLLAKDRVTSPLRAPFTRFEEEGGPGEVEEAARGSGLRRAFGELLLCPYCLGVWIATALLLGLAVAPRPTRWVAAMLSAVFGSDVLQIAYKRVEP